MANTTAPMVSTPLSMDWSGGIIFLSYCVSVQGSYSALMLLQHSTGLAMAVLAAFILSVCGIWCMHFVGMEALDIGIPFTFHVGWTIASMFFAFIPASGALMIARVATRKHPDEESNEHDFTLRGTLQAVLNAPHRWIILAACLNALGVCAMHFTGQYAIISDAKVTANVGVIVAACIIAVAASAAALHFAFVIPLTRYFNAPTALVMGVAVCGMHYTGMYGFSYAVPAGTVFTRSHSHDLSRALYILSSSSFFCCIIVAFSAYLHRKSIRNDVRVATATAEALGEYDIEEAQYILAMASATDDAPSTISAPFQRLLGNLKRYKKFLPSYIVNAQQDTGDLGDTASHISGQSRVSSHSLASRKDALYKKNAVVNFVEDSAIDSDCSVAHRNACVGTVTLSRNRVCSSDFNDVIIAVNKLAMKTGASVHSFVGDTIVVSWNATNTVAQPGVKACRFMLQLAQFMQQNAAHGTFSGSVITARAGCLHGGDDSLRLFHLSFPDRLGFQRSVHGLAAKFAGSVFIDHMTREGVTHEFVTRGVDFVPSTAGSELVYELVAEHHRDENTDQEWMYRLDDQEKNDQNVYVTECALKLSQGDVFAAKASLSRVTDARILRSPVVAALTERLQ